MRRKSDLPVKTCTTCGRAFAWRRKCARDWDAVKHCSARCRRDARGVKKTGRFLDGARR